MMRRECFEAQTAPGDDKAMENLPNATGPESQVLRYGDAVLKQSPRAVLDL
jgi:hypothetical protein